MDDIYDLIQAYVVTMTLSTSIRLKDDYSKLFKRITVRENGNVFISIEDTLRFFNDIPPRRILKVRFHLYRPWALFRYEKKFEKLRDEEFFSHRSKNKFDFFFETNEEFIEFIQRYIFTSEIIESN